MSKNKYEKQSREARKRYRRFRTCERKKAFNTREEAQCKNQSEYQCPYCGKWHRSGKLTTLVNTIKNRRKK